MKDHAKISGTKAALGKLSERIDSLPSDRVIYAHLSVAVLDEDDLNRYGMTTATICDDKMNQSQLATIQTNIVHALWENAHTMDNKGWVPIWSQPPKPLWFMKWYDWLLAGVAIGMLTRLL